MYKFERLCFGCSHELKPCEYISNCDLCINYGFDSKHNELYGLPVETMAVQCKRDETTIKAITKT